MADKNDTAKQDMDIEDVVEQPAEAPETDGYAESAAAPSNGAPESPQPEAETEPEPEAETSSESEQPQAEA